MTDDLVHSYEGYLTWYTCWPSGYQTKRFACGIIYIIGTITCAWINYIDEDDNNVHYVLNSDLLMMPWSCGFGFRWRRITTAALEFFWIYPTEFQFHCTPDRSFFVFFFFRRWEGSFYVQVKCWPYLPIGEFVTSHEREDSSTVPSKDRGVAFHRVAHPSVSILPSFSFGIVSILFLPPSTVLYSNFQGSIGELHFIPSRRSSSVSIPSSWRLAINNPPSCNANRRQFHFTSCLRDRSRQQNSINQPHF